MQFREILQCVKSLNFQPRKKWPENLPAMCWQGMLLCGFERKAGPAVEVYNDTTGGPDFVAAFTDCHPNLRLSELARLRRCLSSSEMSGKMGKYWDELLNFYELRPSPNLDHTLRVLAESPVEFQDWVSEKGLGPRDLAPLRLIKDIKNMDGFFKKIIELRPSKSIGVKCLELAIELTHMKHSWMDLIKETASSEQWLRHLEKLRRPLSFRRDQKIKDHLSTLPWPAHTLVKWQRQGDRSGVEVKFSFASHQELDRKLHGLRHVHQLVSKEPKRLWNS